MIILLIWSAVKLVYLWISMTLVAWVRIIEHSQLWAAAQVTTSRAASPMSMSDGEDVHAGEEHFSEM